MLNLFYFIFWGFAYDFQCFNPEFLVCLCEFDQHIGSKMDEIYESPPYTVVNFLYFLHLIFSIDSEF